MGNRQTNDYEAKGKRRKSVYIPMNAAEMKEVELEIIKRLQTK